MTSPSPVILVTGATRGIGLAIVQRLALSLPSSTILLAARESSSVAPAISEVRSRNPSIDVSNLHGVRLDVTDDESIAACVGEVSEKFGGLDVLVNNAGIAIIPPQTATAAEKRNAFNATLNTNVTSVYHLTNAFLPLLHASSAGLTEAKVINISSARASLFRTANGKLPPTASAAYSVSKTALNALVLEMINAERTYHESRDGEGAGERRVKFYMACPGHCATGLNGYRGKRDPMEGARIVPDLLSGKYDEGYWETEGAEGDAKTIPW